LPKKPLKESPKKLKEFFDLRREKPQRNLRERPTNANPAKISVNPKNAESNYFIIFNLEIIKL